MADELENNININIQQNQEQTEDCVRVSIYKPFPDLRLGARLYFESKGVRDFQEDNTLTIKGRKYNKIAAYNKIMEQHPELLEFTEVVFKIISSTQFHEYMKASYGSSNKILSLKNTITFHKVPEDNKLTGDDDETLNIFWIRLNLREVVNLVLSLEGTAYEIYGKKIVEAIDRVTCRKLDKENLHIMESILKLFRVKKEDGEQNS